MMELEQCDVTVRDDLPFRQKGARVIMKKRKKLKLKYVCVCVVTCIVCLSAVLMGGSEERNGM